MTATLTVAAIVDQLAATVTDGYAASDRAMKAKVRTEIDRRMKAAVAALDIETAKTWMDALARCTTERATAPQQTPAEIIAARVAALHTAADMLQHGAVAPNGWEGEYPSSDDIAKATVDQDAVNRAAERLATMKITRTAQRRGVEAHVFQVLSEHAKNGETMTVREIAAQRSDEYPNGDCSDGAIAARLFPSKGECTFDGIAPVERTNDAPRGARLILSA
jgi:uncharacterized protein (DUF2267 family)